MAAPHQLTPPHPTYVNPSLPITGATDNAGPVGRIIFTANGAGTTTTIVGANAAPGTNDTNVVRRGERFKLFNSSGVLKEEKVFEITTVAVGASTTVTFAPAAAVNTASGDVARKLGLDFVDSVDSLRDRLKVINAGLYTDLYLDKLTINDMLYAVRVADDPRSL